MKPVAFGTQIGGQAFGCSIPQTKFPGKLYYGVTPESGHGTNFITISAVEASTVEVQDPSLFCLRETKCLYKICHFVSMINKYTCRCRCPNYAWYNCYFPHGSIFFLLPNLQFSVSKSALTIIKKTFSGELSSLHFMK